METIIAAATEKDGAQSRPVQRLRSVAAHLHVQLRQHASQGVRIRDSPKGRRHVIRRVPAGADQGIAGVTDKLHQVGHAVCGVAGDSRAERGFHDREIERHVARVVHRQPDGIEVLFAAGLEEETVVHRLAQCRVRPVEQLLLLDQQFHAHGRGGIGRDRSEGPAVEAFENAEFLKPGGIRRAALGNTFKHNRERSRAVSPGGRGRHGAGAAPAPDERVELI